MNEKKTKNVLNGTKKAKKNKIKIKKQTVTRRIRDLGQKNLNGRK